MDEGTPSRQLGELTVEYANNTAFEASIWDLKLIFGEFSNRSGTGSIDWHTSITMPWAQAKLLCYYLQANILVHEIHNGKIRVPSAVIPPEAPVPAGAPDDPKAQDVFAVLKALRHQFLEEQGS